MPLPSPRPTSPTSLPSSREQSPSRSPSPPVRIKQKLTRRRSPEVSPTSTKPKSTQSNLHHTTDSQFSKANTSKNNKTHSTLSHTHTHTLTSKTPTSPSTTSANLNLGSASAAGSAQSSHMSNTIATEMQTIKAQLAALDREETEIKSKIKNLEGEQTVLKIVHQRMLKMNGKQKS